MDMTAGGFHEKFEKMTSEHSVFERIDIFLTKYGLYSCVLFREWTFFYKIWAWEWSFVREKSEKKGILTFLAHIIVWFWPNLRILINYGHKGLFHEKFKKNEMRTLCFWEMDVFSTKYGAWEYRVYREWTFVLKKYEHKSSYFSWNSGKQGYPIDFFNP